MWTIAAKLLGWALGFLFPVKDERDTERAAGEALGAARAGQDAAVGELNAITKADAARTSVADAPDDILRDPANAGPANPGKPG